MSEASSSETKPATGLGVAVYCLAGPVVICLAGIGGHFGERLGGGAGYWVGCYLTALLAAVAVALLFARLFHGHPFYWALGSLGLLLGGHLTWFALGGKVGDAPKTGSDHVVIGGAALAGMLLGFAAAHPFVVRRSAKPQDEPPAPPGSSGRNP
jgi:hypothetical protein